jgi:xylulokinase
MSDELVVGVDSSTQSTKAVAWTPRGETVAEGRAPVPLSSPKPGYAEQDVEDWWRATCAALSELTTKVDPARIAGLAISNQRETVAVVDEALKAKRPAIVWLDERAVEEIPRLTGAFGAERLHAISGKPPDITPVVYRLSWLRRHQPEVLEGARLLDVHGFLTGRLTGTPTASWTSADPFGVFDIEAKTWSAPILEHLGLSPERFAALAPPGAQVGTVTAAAAEATGLRAGTPVFAGGGDGQCAGLGANAVRPGTVYLNLGTAIITGAWSATPRIGKSWRTMTSQTGEGYFLEGCQRAGAFFINWFVDTFSGGHEDPKVFARLEEAATALPVGSEGVTVCPYLSGVMDPHWDPQARAAFHGLGASHGLGHLYRASLEALTLESARCVATMQADGLAPQHILAVGGGVNSRLWVRMMADSTGLPITRSENPEASSLGAAMSAAVGLGWHDGFMAAASEMSRTGPTVDPDPSQRAAWEELSVRQAAAYRRVS